MNMHSLTAVAALMGLGGPGAYVRRRFRATGATPEQTQEIIDRLNHFKRQGSRAWRWKGARR